MQHGHRLAGPGAAGDLGRAGVAGPVSDLALARVQERPPLRERVGQDELQFLLPGHEGDLAGGALHGGDQVVGVHLFRRRARRRRAGRPRPGPRPRSCRRPARAARRTGRRAAPLPALPGRFAGQQPDRREDLGVDAEPGQVGVADVGEQLSRLLLGIRRAGLQVLDGLLVADLQDAEHAVDAEPVAGGVGVGLVLREDGDQAVGVCGRSAFRGRGRRRASGRPPAACGSGRPCCASASPAAGPAEGAGRRWRWPRRRRPERPCPASRIRPGSPWRSLAVPLVMSSPSQLSPSWLCPKGAC